MRNTRFLQDRGRADRRKAIELAIESAGPEDIVLLAGKGHETYQIIGTTKYDFSDKDIARQCLQGPRCTPSATADTGIR